MSSTYNVLTAVVLHVVHSKFICTSISELSPHKCKAEQNRQFPLVTDLEKKNIAWLTQVKDKNREA